MQSLNLNLLFRRFLPFLFCLFLILSGHIPFHFLPNYPYSVSWLFIPIFYYAIYNPKCLSSWAVFLVGLFADFLTQSPFGVMTFCYVLVFFVANLLRKYLREMNFWLLWAIFSTLLMLILLLEYGLMVLEAPFPIAFVPVLVEFCILVLTYPFLMRFCAALDRKIREAA